MTEEAQNIITTIKQMEASLDDEKDRGYDLDTSGMRITFPLNECLRDLKQQYNTVSKLHRERFEQVKKLVQALESYSSHLESSFVKIRLPPTSSNTCPPNFDLSPSYVTTLDEEFTRVYDEYNKRLSIVQQVSEEIVRLWSELGIPQAQTDSSIVEHYRDSPEQLGLHQSDIDRLKGRRDKLIDEKKNREKRLADVRASIETLWDRLGIEQADRKAFLAANRGCGLRTINEFEDELSRLNELKRQNLHLFVEDSRVRLQELWDALYFSEEEMLEFTPAFSDVYSDALLSAHEAEIDRLHTLKEQRAPVLEAIDKHKSLIADKKALEESAADATRLMMKPQKGEKRDPGKLLREEKMRKRIAKELPKVAAALKKTLEKYEDDFGKPFLVHGQSYLEEMEEMEARAPPPRPKTPNGLPPRPKTPGATTTTTVPTKGPATSSRNAQPPRPQSSMRNHAPSKSITKTPTTAGRSAGRTQLPASAASTAASTQKSPSRIPARVPLGHLQHGNNSPERRHAPHPQPPPSHANEARSMGPPRAPPPKMRDLVSKPPPPEPSSVYHAPPPRPESTLSNESSRFVRPMSPEDVYDDRERMSYMSTSMLNRDRQFQYHQQQYPSLNHQPQQELFHQSMSRSVQGQMLPPPAPVSRQTSNTSSNLTNGTTATSTSASENWETYSDYSEAEPDARNDYYRMQMQASSNAGKRGPGGYGHMAPPPAKMRMHPSQIYGHRMEEQDENRGRVDGSDAAWSTEPEETY
jgi:Ase1/PRC1/MAP65 family protein